MGLSTDLISQFVKVAKTDKKVKTESTVYGTVVEYNGKNYVKFDGSDLLTPISTTASAKPGERVTVMIKNHTATVTGNMSSPAARSGDVQDLNNIVADKVSTEELEAEIARIETLEADNAKIKELVAGSADIGDLVVDDALIKRLEAVEAEVDSLDVEVLDAKYATIESLNTTNANVNRLETTYADVSGRLTAVEADIKDLDVGDLDAKYANIDFTNIGEAAIRAFFTKSGMIENVIIGDATVTGSIVGVTIKGDLIEAGTIKADKLVIKNDKDGLYYKLNIEGGATVSETVTEEQLQNGLSGSVILANSITAEKIRVDDLVAFGATIGGMHIDSDSLYSGVKESIDSTTEGFYFGADGQFAVGDSNNYLKFFEDTDGTFKLVISANSIMLGSKSVEESITEVQTNVDQLGSDVHQTILEEKADIIQTTNESVASALESYAKASDVDAVETALSSSLAVEVDAILATITAEREYSVDIDGRLESFKELIETYFSFETDGLRIGKKGNPFETLLSNSKLSFIQDGQEIAYIQHNKLYILNAHFIEGITLGNYSDGSMWAFEVDDYGIGIVWRDAAST